MPNTSKKQFVVIKGTKDGLTFLLDDQCTLDHLKEELKDKLSERPETLSPSQGPIKAKIVIGTRYLNLEQEKELESLFSQEMNVRIEAIESEVISKVKAEEIRQLQQINRIVTVVRSGQVLEVKGDLLLIGDVNPGATVKATGSIYIMGKLRGIAHAGYLGEDQAVICASTMEPTQLRVASIIRRPPEDDEELQSNIECAYVNDDKEMVLDKLLKLRKIRPTLSMDI
ncbi:septum site-determining protein MinC [Salipaludibacillus neizhouensis]|uniref:Probable septum site-determining protein MinC n=1 Tax=Salipaludibacillus neizhouensis TaxID=885475 RepID=A0A3A9KEH4_9BACI|nr:septum site-determining protein MinC [Salipaludibacillus neizhouensis]RKL65905.1 septum site-determining protein MinC [Salipaludibacillus neizhouensis]